MSKTKETIPHPEDGWEVKDRTYFLLGDREPLTFTLKIKTHGKISVTVF